MKYQSLLLLLGSTSVLTEFYEPKPTSSLNTTAGCGDFKVRGVNLAGWLVMEPWITPSLFDEYNAASGNQIIDEYTHAQHAGKDLYKERTKKHWRTFVSQEDLQKVVNAGISHFRIPLAHWFLDVDDGEPFPQPNLDEYDEGSPFYYLKDVLQKIENLGAQAILDLHTAPGSQNGYDDSGHRGDSNWVGYNYPVNSHNIARTYRIIDRLASYFRNWIDNGIIRMNTLYGIGVLNEPHICADWTNNGQNWHICKNFFPKAVALVRHYFNINELKVIIDQAGRQLSDFNGVIYEQGGVEVDAHNYQAFGQWADEVATSPDGWQTHLKTSCDNRAIISNSPMETFAGEFSLAVTECQKHVTGYNVPPINSESTCWYYGSDRFDSYSEDHKAFLKNYFLAQLDAFESGRGWIFMNMKTENSVGPVWDFLYLLNKGIIPGNLCNRPSYC